MVKKVLAKLGGCHTREGTQDQGCGPCYVRSGGARAVEASSLQAKFGVDSGAYIGGT